MITSSIRFMIYLALSFLFDKLMFMGDFATKPVGKFCVAFPKATAHPTRGALVAARTRRNLLIGVFFFAKLFSLRLYCQRKKRINDLKMLCVERGPPTCAVLHFAKAKYSPPQAVLPSAKPAACHSPLRWRFRTARSFAPCEARPPSSAAQPSL